MPKRGTPTAGRARRSLVVDIIVESARWKTERGIASVLRRAIAAAAAATPTRGNAVTIVLTNDSAMRALNRTWRRKDNPTNVLSFPATPPPPGSGVARALGDIVIAYQTARREARSEDKPFRNHIVHLAVHGFLHLAGYDHTADEEAEAMEELEIAILADLNVPNPYIAPAPRR
jgi:probable rRNA maturation factor